MIELKIENIDIINVRQLLMRDGINMYDAEYNHWIKNTDVCVYKSIDGDFFKSKSDYITYTRDQKLKQLGI